MASYYAWSNFPVERNEWGQVTKTIEVGESITADKISVSKEEFDELIEIGAVSEEEYPDIPDSVSPAEYEMSQANQQAVIDELQMRIDEQKEPAPTPTQEEDKPSAQAQSAKSSTANKA